MLDYRKLEVREQVKKVFWRLLRGTGPVTPVRGLTKIGPVLEGKQLPLSLIDRDSGIQKVFEFVKVLVRCCRGHFHEAVYDGFPFVILDEAFDS